MNETPVIKLTQSRLGWCRIKIYGKNGREMLTSETYFSKANAKRAGLKLHAETGFPFFDMTTLHPENERGRQGGYVDVAVFGYLLVFLIILGLIFSAFFVRFKLSNERVSGIVYNTTNDRAISGATCFYVRAGENTYVDENNTSNYCVPKGSKYIPLINKAAEDKRIKVVVVAHKYGLTVKAPWTVVPNVTVAEVK